MACACAVAAPIALGRADRWERRSSGLQCSSTSARGSWPASPIAAWAASPSALWGGSYGARRCGAPA
eukprot:3773304-Lingulodinium_polyedra.AAC.1